MVTNFWNDSSEYSTHDHAVSLLEKQNTLHFESRLTLFLVLLIFFSVCDDDPL